MLKLGFVGAGNMAGAIIDGVTGSGFLKPNELGVCDTDGEKLKRFTEMGLKAFQSASELLDECDAALIAVKPQSFPSVASALKAEMSKDKLLISIMAGITADAIFEAAGSPCRLVLAMPNTPVMLGEGATALDAVPPATAKDLAFTRGIFESAGLAVEIPLGKIGEVIPLNGSSPAFFYEMAETLARFGEQNGIPFEASLTLAAKTMLGSARMLLESGKTPHELIDMVCSPGGTTLAAMEALRARGFSGAVEAACGACVRRAKELAAENKAADTERQDKTPKKAAVQQSAGRNAMADTGPWYESAFFYHIYPLGFCGAPAQNDGVTQSRINKVLDWIPHIAGMGVDAIYFGPVFESDAHGYDTRDYLKLDCRLGTEQDFARVCEKLHEAGIKTVLDGVFNHVGRGFWAFKDVLANREHSSFKDWFFIDFGRQGQAGDGFWYEGWEGHYELVKLNLKNRDVRDYLFGCVARWVELYGIDGLRLDVAYMLDEDFIRALRGFVKSLNPNFFLLGEAIHGDYSRIVNAEMLDSCTNYECYKGVWSSFNDRNMFEIGYSLNRQFGPEHWTLYKGKQLLSFLDNHDVTRFASILKDDANLEAAYGLLFAMPGIPCVYYGSEWGEKAEKSQGDSALRPSFPAPVKNGLTAWMRTLAEIRGQNAGFRHGGYRQLYLTNGQMVFERESGGNRVIAGINLTDSPHVTGVLPTSGKLFDLVNNRYVDFSGQLVLPPNSALLLRCD